MILFNYPNTYHRLDKPGKFNATMAEEYISIEHDLSYKERGWFWFLENDAVLRIPRLYFNSIMIIVKIL